MAEFFKVVTDRYDGITIDTAQQSFKDDAVFLQNLKGAVSEWKVSGKRGLWIKVASLHSSLVPLLTEMGFDFHHAQPGYVMMTLWMCDNHPNELPEYANQYIGVGGFVVNEKNQLLVMQERYGQNKKSPWKLPGGHANKGEDLIDTAQREVLEETGVECEFVSLLAFRHQHNYRFGCSDIYFICVMRPITQEIKPCPREVSDCQWMDLDEYISDPTISDANRHFALCYKENIENGFSIIPSKVLSFDKRVLNNIYSIKNIQDRH
ncbi:hypothetical protein C0Q70_06741 [Pomacea canaliculata]|uniref:Nudix hydrolase domain-containing protein n=1 Tax=Pomacea canaliculata TaxID=400727 RepID=A0A2T7PD46_POMCA|nr:nudix hydrolase 8-like [Pomacea canaliculata]XP_025092894.1 nudix hydrolase 8-like [Pomacea canaliculata]PVD31329.1 hypothetical protein C0Q70_06741 [Pomacea canaliculata]